MRKTVANVTITESIQLSELNLGDLLMIRNEPAIIVSKSAESIELINLESGERYVEYESCIVDVIDKITLNRS